MNSLLVYTDNGNYIPQILSVLYILSTLCAIFVITSKNPVVSILYLIGLFICIGSYLITIGINFLGISYLLVYVGAVSILFIFIVMLINIKISELVSVTRNSIPLALIITILFSYSLSSCFAYSNLLSNNVNLVSKLTNKFDFKFSPVYTNDVSYVNYNTWEGILVDINDISSIGNMIYTNYSIWLVVTSVILLLAMVGTIVIVIKQKKD